MSAPAARARGLLRADAAFELALGSPLALAPLDALGRLRLPPPASPPLIKGFGAALLPFAALLWRLSASPQPRALRALAGVNALTGFVLGAWVRRGDERRSQGLVMAVAALLVAFAAAEFQVSRQFRGRRGDGG